MNKKFITILVALIFIISCNRVPKNKNMQTSLSEANSTKQTNQTNVKKKYNEEWNINITGIRQSNNDYDGFWRVYRIFQDDYGRKNYQMFDIIFNIKSNYWLLCRIFDGFNTFEKKYKWNLLFSVLEQEERIDGFELLGIGLTGIDDGLPKNYVKDFSSITKIETDGLMRSYIIDLFEGVSTGYVETNESSKIFPRQNKLQNLNIFGKQIPDPFLDQYISVDPMEGMWYLATDDSPASEEAFMNTKAVLVIGKDEELNPGWYHVVLYYDSGNEDTGWICEWGAAEIAEKELYVQLSSMSEGKPFTIELNEKDGMRWLSLKHQAQQIKEGQFVRILPLK